MLRTFLILSLSTGACAPTTHTTPSYIGGGTRSAASAASSSRGRGIAVRGRIPRGKRVDFIVAVQIDRAGRRKRVRVRPARDGSYQMQLAPGHRYAMAYEERGRLVGNVSFPSAGGRQTQVINLSQNVVVNQHTHVDLGEPTYVGGVYVAAHDPEAYLDSDADGLVDAQDPDDLDDDQLVADAGAFEGDFEEVPEDDLGGDDGGGHDDGGAPPYDGDGGDGGYDGGNDDGDDD
ncbi:MAG: hypothetical protein H0X17_08035 [Deltaproteobacteria bacterium]|nr:hypothetical protein [Deltaproteobacteria bacterium]